MRPVCNMDCFNCQFDDCICDILRNEDIEEIEARDRKFDKKKAQKEANNERAKAYYREHREEKLQYAKEYQAKHREELLPKKREYYQHHKAEYAANQRKRSHNDPEHFLAKRRKYYHTDHPVYGKAALAAQRDARNARNREKYGERQKVLLDVRKRLGMAQTTIAKIVGTSGATWGNWEKGNFQCDVDAVLAVIAKMTGKTKEELMGAHR